MDANTLTLMMIQINFQIMSVSACSADCCVYSETDCQDYKDAGYNESGVYHVKPLGMRFGFKVYCDMITDGGGWLVFQRRFDGSENFFRGMNDYEYGFGNAISTSEYWLGLIPLHRIISQGHYELRVDLAGWLNNTRYAKYNDFSIRDSTDNYKLKAVGYSGDAGNAMKVHNGMKFSAKDSDNDRIATKNCADRNQGAWWYSGCLICNGQANLNGFYYHGENLMHPDGIYWKQWLRNGQESFYSLKKVEMKIRKA